MPSQLVSDCPRCGTSKVAFDLAKNYRVPSTLSPKIYDCFCVCGQCHKTVVFNLRAKGSSSTISEPSQNSAINRDYDILGFQTLHGWRNPPPDHIPPAINKVFVEGSTCLAVKCYNAGATMFRLCLDIATKELLPASPPPGLTPHIQRNLGPRLGWLLDSGLLPETLRELSQCVKDDGNAGAHDGSLGVADAEDLMDFTFVLLERLYTEPKRLELAAERRIKRHTPPTP